MKPLTNMRILKINLTRALAKCLSRKFILTQFFRGLEKEFHLLNMDSHEELPKEKHALLSPVGPSPRRDNYNKAISIEKNY